jgi:hypothetical protein
MAKLHISPSPGTLIATVALLVALGGTALAARPSSNPVPVFTRLALINGWTDGGFRTAKPAVAVISGIVHFKGAMSSSGSDSEAFILPAKFRPRNAVFVQVGMCDGTTGRLIIGTNGITSVHAENDFTNAACFTSLDGASFAR